MRVLLLLLLLPAACAQTDPFYRPGDWVPQGANERNIAAMLAEPTDMVRGRGEIGADSPLAIEAVNRLMHDKVKPLASTASQNDIAPPAAPTGTPGGS
jgi:type IV pilus biogenesis protein CpaD/CtpE